MVYYGGEKMSKSLGNLVMVDDLLKSWSTDALRLYLASHHYREEWSYDEDELALTGQIAERLRHAATAVGDDGASLEPSGARAAFGKAMDDDLDTPTALSVLKQLADDILEAADAEQDVAAAQEALRELGSVFGLLLDAEKPQGSVVEGWDRHLQHFT
jgi:cysteinyl-tRNA synthetase